jgi:hypothetical protein
MNLEETTWAIRVKAYSIDSYYEKALQHASNPDTIYEIRHAYDLTNTYPWLIVVIEDDYDFIMDEVKTKEEAIKLCQTMNWRLI